MYLFIVFILIYPLYSQNIPNSSFENWTNGKPNGWDASNEIIVTTNVITVVKDTSSLDGNYCARIRTKTVNILVNSITIPGLITLGDFVINLVNMSADINGGIPFTGRPDTLSGYFISSPVAGDSAMIVVGFASWDSISGRDSIGWGLIYISNSVNKWTQFKVPIDWSSPAAPDSMNIIIISSDVVNNTQTDNSTIWIDNLSFIYNTVSIEDIDFNSGIMVFPDAGGDELIIQFRTNPTEKVSIRIYNMNGQLVREKEISNAARTESIGIRHLLTGIYILEVTSGNSERFTQKIKIH